VIARIRNIWRIDPFSLRVRLTVGIAAVSALGLSSVAIWTTWQMQQILIGSHKRHVEDIARRLPRDAEIYSEMFPVATGVQKAVDNLTAGQTFLWVNLPDGTNGAKSANLNSTDATEIALLSLRQVPASPQVFAINHRYFVMCARTLRINGKLWGQLFVAQDISDEQTMFLAVVQSLGVTSLLILIAITGAIALYIQRSLQPLMQINQLAAKVSAADLGQAQLQCDRAPTEVRELARTYNMMLERLAAAWEQQEQFVSNVSHELRTPLTIVYGYLQSVLRRETNLTTTQRDALETAASEADRTIRLLQDLLDLARADSGHLHFHIEAVPLNALVAEVAGMAQQYSNRDIIIEANDEIIVLADRHRLKQVLLNLIDNAVKYSDFNLPIALKIDQLEQARIQVCDRGVGIPLQQQARIFERFYRVDESRATSGYGLGLSIVKTLVDGMGGCITVASRLGEGSVFTITLPIAV
jgi:signal transduction histidine kinase